MLLCSPGPELQCSWRWGQRGMPMQQHARHTPVCHPMRAALWRAGCAWKGEASDSSGGCRLCGVSRGLGTGWLLTVHVSPPCRS